MNSKLGNTNHTLSMEQKSTWSTAKRCFKCHQVGHLQKKCKAQTPESRRGGGAGKKVVNQVTGTPTTDRQETQTQGTNGNPLDPVNYLWMESDEEAVKIVTVSDSGIVNHVVLK